MNSLPLRSLALLGFLLASVPVLFAAEPVRLTEVTEVIPTYKSAPPDPNPMFYFGRQSQGAEGRTYPYPLYDNLTNQKGEQSYRLIYLENEYVKIGIMPELGGRLFSAVDKTNNYDYVYRQHVIKPALIGLIGAWISGGIEWNIPHHHRASTFLPVQHRTEERADGGKTVWVGELEVRHRMRWAVGYTLRPGSNVLECSLRILNRTPLLNSMLCFANVAVNANENYQIIFPPSTQWATHHSKREYSEWPISRSRYGGADFTAGVDVSWYKNHQNSNSMFAWNYTDDFFAGYDHGKQAGTMSIADHHVVPGKKFWTWGNGPRGRMWDDILTDTDGPYVELMVGAYSDNQPDYSWLQPFESRAFEINWYPFRDIGGVKNANLDAAVNLEVKDGTAKFGFNTTRAFPAATVRLKAGDKLLVEEQVAINPAKPYTKQVAVPAGVDPHDVRASLSADGREIVAYAPLRLKPIPQPAVVVPPPAPKEMKTAEELYLAGLRIDQFHNPSLEPEPYWEEALRRDPGDTAAHTGLGLLDLRRAKFASAERHFRAALERLTAKFTSPKNAEPLYYLGVALKAQDRNDEAVEAFARAAWSQEWKSPAYFALAELATARGDFNAALKYAEQSIDANALNVRAYAIKSAALRHFGLRKEALTAIATGLVKADPLDVRLMAERWLITNDGEEKPAESRELFSTLADHIATAQELAAEYANAGLWRDGADVLREAIKSRAEVGKSPIMHYYLGHFAEKMRDAGSATRHRQMAVQQSPEYVFPFQAELIPILRRAMEANPSDARAPYYLGNLLFDWQPAEAVTLWEKSAALDPKFAVTWRNLAQAYSHQDGDAGSPQHAAKAIAALEKAVALGDSSPTHFAELDALYQAAGTPVEKRLGLLEKHQRAVAQKDEGLAALIALKTVAGRPDEAIALLRDRTFSIWEGGTRFNTGQAWTDAHLVRGLQRLNAKQYREALADFDAALTYPANLRVAETRGGSRQAEVAYWNGTAHEALGQMEQARAAWTRATAPETAPAGRRGGGPSMQVAGRVGRYYQALALRKLGQADHAEPILRELVTTANASLVSAGEPPDPNASYADRQNTRTRTANSHFLAGLGHAGLGDKEKARQELQAALAQLPDHLGAKIALTNL